MNEYFYFKIDNQNSQPYFHYHWGINCPLWGNQIAFGFNHKENGEIKEDSSLSSPNSL